MILSIINHPNPLLRTPGQDVRFPLSPAHKKLARDMFDTVQAANGIGLAAPQVSKSVNLIVVNLEQQGLPIFALFNPKVIKSSKDIDTMEEGCLSIPGVYGQVARPKKITFEGYNVSGKKIVGEAEGIVAKVLQHEIDHINGILIIDKITEYTQGKRLLKQMEKGQ